jgi:hypothetical protein
MPTFEDTAKLLETVLVISALLLSFSISGFQSLNHEDFLQADKRWLLAFHGPANLDDTSLFVPSLGFLSRTYQCLGIFTTVLITSTALYGSLIFSDSRDNKEEFKRWSGIMQYFIISEYIAVLAGVIILLQVNLSLVDINFPLYYIDELCVGRGTDSACIANNVTFDMSDAVDCPSKRGASRCLSWADFAHQSTVQYYMKNIIIIFSVGSGAVLVLHFLIFFRGNKTPETERLSVEEIRSKYKERFECAQIQPNECRNLGIDLLISHLNIPLGHALQLQEAE